MQIHVNRRMLPALLLLILVIAALVYLDNYSSDEKEQRLEASGTVETVEITVAPEMAGRVAAVLVDEGDPVLASDPLLQLEDDLLQAQRRQTVTALETTEANLGQARAAVNTAQTALAAAQTNVDAAQVQYELALSAARFEALPARVTAWAKRVPETFSQPVWYFQKPEHIAAAEAEVDAARKALATEGANLDEMLQDASNADFVQAETRLAETQAAFLVAQDVLARAQVQDDEALKDSAQELYDAAGAELDAAQLAYDQMLTDQAADDVLQARARLAVAQERYETAQDHLNQRLTGDDALQVRAAAMVLEQAKAGVRQAEANVTQVEAGVTQAKKAVAQAQAQVDLMDLQIDKLTVRAAVSGVVMTRDVEPGQIVQPGAAVMMVGKLDELTITVYVTEDRYGRIELGQRAEVTVDSFPDQVFDARVTRVADRAEYTPRNVQTQDGRRTTVFAVKLSVNDPQGFLKPGMPADVVFAK